MGCLLTVSVMTEDGLAAEADEPAASRHKERQQDAEAATALQGNVQANAAAAQAADAADGAAAATARRNMCAMVRSRDKVVYLHFVTHRITASRPRDWGKAHAALELDPRRHDA